MPGIQLFSSLRFTLAVMAGLAAAALLSYKNPAISTMWVALPLSVLAFNLLVVIFTNPRFRKQYGLMTFHLGLLAVILLALLDQMTLFQGRLEITEGQEFDPATVTVVRQGPWHQNSLGQINFTQQRIEVDFFPEIVRGDTRSQILLPDASANETRLVIGDRKVWTARGYRFLTTANKGYSLLLSWQDESGEVITGALNMPSYPSMDWKQENQWITPAGQQLSLKFDPGSAPLENQHWRLEREFAKDARLTVTLDGKNMPLAFGESMQMGSHRLSFSDLRMWMGYRVDYQPWLSWQFIAAVIAIVGLAIHFWGKFSLANTSNPAAQRQQSGLTLSV